MSIHMNKRLTKHHKESAIGAASTLGMVHNLTSVKLLQGLWLLRAKS
jgi:hypothetical protein